jgi:soluble lytic murein transglycosylase-like protein
MSPPAVREHDAVRVAKTAVCTGICLACLGQGVAALAAAGSEAGPARATVEIQSAAAAAPLSPLTPLQALNLLRLRAAQRIKIGESPSGRKVIFNEGPVERARRFAGELLPVPDLPGLPSGALEPLIVRHSGEHRLDPRLVRAVIQIESGYNYRARSNRGAMGLMQLMPETAVELAVRDPYDADQNLRGGTAYLRQLIDSFRGSLEMALAAYNAGPGAVERHRGVPPYPETIDYVQRVLALYRGGGAPAVVPAVASVAASRPGRRPAPYVTRGASGRLLVTTSLSGLR